jgi:hypothetical protein
VESKETPFQTTLQLDDVTYSLRHVEESWIHLLKAGMRRIYVRKKNTPRSYLVLTDAVSSWLTEHISLVKNI